MSDTTYKSKVGYKPPVELDYHEGTPEIKSVWDNMRDSEGKILDQMEEHIVAQCSVAVGVKIDRDELIKALKYDRGQYEKGYADGKRDAMEALQVEQEKTVTQIFGEEQQEWEEYCTGLMNRIRELKEQLPKWGEIVRCGECKWYQPDLCANPWGVCFCEDWVANNIGHTVDEDGFCYRGERKVQE